MGKKTNFILGAGLGLGLGMLFAPQSGDETRKELKIRLDELVCQNNNLSYAFYSDNELLDKIKSLDAKEVADNITKKVNELKEELANLDKETVMEIAKEKAEKIKEKADELVKMAVQKGTPAVQKAAKEVRNATSDFLSNMADKIITVTST